MMLLVPVVVMSLVPVVELVTLDVVFESVTGVVKVYVVVVLVTVFGSVLEKVLKHRHIQK